MIIVIIVVIVNMMIVIMIIVMTIIVNMMMINHHRHDHHLIEWRSEKLVCGLWNYPRHWSTNPPSTFSTFSTSNGDNELFFFSKFRNEINYFRATENDEKDEKRGNGSGLRDLAFDISRVSLKSGDTAPLHCATYQQHYTVLYNSNTTLCYISVTLHKSGYTATLHCAISHTARHTRHTSIHSSLSVALLRTTQ